MGPKRMALVAGLSVCALAAITESPAAAATGCTSSISALENKVDYFSGTANASFVSGTMTSTVDSPLVVTMSIDHSASDLSLGKLNSDGTLYPGVKGQQDAFSNENGPTGGTVTVDDTYNDNQGGGPDTQTGSGPTFPANNTVSMEEGANDLFINPTNCTYQYALSFGVDTTTVGSGSPDDPGIDDRVMTPTEPIPSNLVFQGTDTTVPVRDNINGTDGGYSLAYNNSWGQELDDFFPHITTPASFTWKLTPTYRKVYCYVPYIVKLTEKQAEKQIKASECSIGKITKRASTKVHKGLVISSSPRGGTKKAEGAKVSFVVSTGKKR
jgi:PASTA domain